MKAVRLDVWGQSRAKVGSPQVFPGHERCSLHLKKALEATTRVPTRFSPSDPECQSGLLAQLNPVPCPCCLLQAGTCIYIPHGWAGRGGFVDQMRAEGWEKKKIHPFTH